jgi:molybdopterin synthase sulfur carrier subunit
MPALTLRYFASVREAVGCGSEQLSTDAADCAALRHELMTRGDVWAEALAPGRAVRVAVNQVLQHDERAALNPGDEVAFFPPVTGG